MNVLCIDDDPITLMLCKKVIEKVNFASTIFTSNNGEEALEFFNILNQDKEFEKIDIVFLDLNMPIMNGWEFLDEYIKNQFDKVFHKTKFIVLSSTIDPKDINKSKTYDIVIDFISKPITKELLENLKTKLN
ncbi:MAG TPA: response regulator [Flavobacterium lutivivi]|nr:response regulator [Flavobacterium lutivivi]